MRAARSSSSSAQALALPESSVLARDGYPFVYTVGADSIARLKRIETGARHNGLVEVSAGLAREARVVATGAGFVRDGDLVRIAPVPPRNARRPSDPEHVRHSIRQPIPAIVLFILLTFAGLVGFKKLGINQFPDVDIPFVTRDGDRSGGGAGRARDPGHAHRREAVATVGDVVHITSNVQDGVSSTTVEFVFGKDIDRAVNDVRDAVTRVRSDLPGSINEPVITRSTTSGGPMLTYTVKAPGAARPSCPGSSTTRSRRRSSRCRAWAR